MPCSREYQFVSLFSIVALTGVTFSTGGLADDAEIDDDRTSTVDTTSLMGNAGTLTITENGSITVGSGAALTLTGDHSLVMQGTIGNEHATNATGLGVYTDDLRLTSDITIDGAFEIPGPDDEDTASNNIALGIFGNGIFDGDLTLNETATIDISGGGSKAIFVGTEFIGDIFSDAVISVAGDGSIGIDLAGDITGDVTIDGTVSVRNADSIGIRQTGAIDGAFVHQGGLSVGESTYTDTDSNTVDAIPATAGILIANDVSGGVMLGGEGEDYEDDGSGDAIPTSSIISYGGAPALVVRNDKADGSDLLLGAVDGLDYGLIHRGSISVNGQSSGLEATGVQIGGGSASAATVIEGGLHIDDGIIDVSALDASSTGIRLAEGAYVPEIWNRGIIEATTSVALNDDDTYSAGGDAFGIVVEEGATLAEFNNEGALQVSASGADGDAFGLVDRSGTLTSITNSGTWYVARGTNNSGQTIALDTRLSDANVSFTNEGTFIGDIMLGSGDDSVSLTGGTLTGDIDFGTGANSFTISGDTEFDGSLSHSGTLAFYLQGADLTLGSDDVLTVTSATLSDNANLGISVDPIKGEASLVTADGAVSVGEDVTLTALFDTFLTEEQTYKVLEAGSLSFDGDLITGQGAFLMHSSMTLSDDGNAIFLTVRPKTSDELGFSGNRATLYENIFTSLDPSDALGGALAQLGSAEDVENALQAMMPDTTASSLQLAYTGVLQLEASLNDRLIEASSGRRLEGGFWAREVVGMGTMDGSTSGQSIDYIGAGIMAGFDKALSGDVLWGIGTGFLLQGAERVSGFGDDVSVFSPYLQTYLIARKGAAFASASASIWYNSAERKRELDFESVDKLVESTMHGFTTTADVHVGYGLTLGGLHVTPKVGVSYMRVKEGTYTETGGDGGNMVVDSRTYNRLDGVARLSIGHDFRWSGQGENATIIRPELFAGYRKNLSGNENVLTVARFESGSDWFDLENDPIADKSYEMGAALNIFSGFGVASLRYAYETRDDWKTHYGGFNFQMRF